MFRRFGLPERLLAILLLVVIVDFAANTFLFERANSFELGRDDAERIAESLVLASRAIEATPTAERPAVARKLSTPRFALNWAKPQHRHQGSVGLVNLRSQILEFGPELQRQDLRLYLEGLPGSNNIGGSIRLGDRSVLEFHSHSRSAWKLTAGRVFSFIMPTLLLVTLTWALLRTTLKPLRSLIRATGSLGTGPPKPVPESGPDELRELIRALNDMQERIHQSMVDRTQTMLAIGHDLKTPLARMRLRLDDDAITPEVRDGFNHDIDEMRMLLESIQAYVDNGGDGIPAERIDVAVMAETLVDTAADHGANATYSGASNLEIVARPVSIRRAMANLIENALHYGGNARVSVRRIGWGSKQSVEIVIEDDGPGIPEGQLADALQPFVRLDTARARDTAGMGLGLPIVQRAVDLEGGTLDLCNISGGGLRATIRLPLAPD